MLPASANKVALPVMRGMILSPPRPTDLARRCHDALLTPHLSVVQFAVGEGRPSLARGAVPHGERSIRLAGDRDYFAGSGLAYRAAGRTLDMILFRLRISLVMPCGASACLRRQLNS